MGCYFTRRMHPPWSDGSNFTSPRPLKAWKPDSVGTVTLLTLVQMGDAVSFPGAWQVCSEPEASQIFYWRWHDLPRGFFGDRRPPAEHCSCRSA
jgi:hypothetical protein